MAENNTSNIGFEKQIWDAACVLRGNIDASEYKSVVLGLIFLKYISDRFEAKYKELVEEGDGFEEDQDEYTAENIFFVPENARWSAIAAAAHTPEIGTVIDDAMRSIEKENKRLKDILPKNFARPELDKRRLGEVVDLFTNIQMIEHGSSKDILGRTYEYCLSKFAEQEGKLAGEFYTPSCVVRTLVEVLQPFNGRVYDPCCGSGGMFVQSAKFIENHGGNINKISVFGQDSNPTTWKMATMNLAIRGIDADLGEQRVDDAGLQRGEDVLPDQAEHGHGRHREEEEQGTGEVTAEELAVEHHSQRQGDHGDEHGGGHRVQQREAEAREQRRILEALHVVREPHELRVREIVTGVIGEAEHQALQEWDEDHHDEHHHDRQQEACRGEVLHEVAVTTLLEMQRLYLISGMWTRR